MALEKILVVDDEGLVRNFLSETLKRKNFEVSVAENGMKALDLLKKDAFDLVITDMRMPDLTGIDIIKKVKELSPTTAIIVITAFGSIENAVEAMRLGAFNYLIKPFSPDTIEAVIEKVQEHLSLQAENRFFKETQGHMSQDEMISESPIMKKIMEEVLQVAKSNANCLIHGPSGVGKEVIASAIHNHSFRSEKPFIKVNCAAIPETLIESEFFGHEKGSFTGAESRRLGRFELADRGTLLLDEITEVPLTLQPKLLRAVQEQEFERVGGVKPIRVDVRIISTTNRDIQHAIREKALREDLYYRLNVIPIEVPPLKEREEDIIPLARHFLKKFSKENHLKEKRLSNDSEKLLKKYDWPGNVRELSNIIERAVVISPSDIIQAESLSLNQTRPELTPPRGFAESEGDNIIKLPIGSTLEELEKRMIIETLDANNQNRTRTAKMLNISVRTLRNKLQSYENTSD
ncbi:MAG: sigma-54-dependent Fis family transcriptional regulator [Chlamydiia bacterium]|nr:sigma-54-dependent Fis family transcriptional regulator [Chlamydiia bacterium]